MSSLVWACLTFYVEFYQSDFCRFIAMTLSPLHLVVIWPVFTIDSEHSSIWQSSGGSKGEAKGHTRMLPDSWQIQWNTCHQVAFFGIQILQNSISAKLRPGRRWGSLRRCPRPLSRLRSGYPFTIPYPSASRPGAFFVECCQLSIEPTTLICSSDS